MEKRRLHRSRSISIHLSLSKQVAENVSVHSDEFIVVDQLGEQAILLILIGGVFPAFYPKQSAICSSLKGSPGWNTFITPPRKMGT
jgi:hypothetical protein